MKKIITLQIQVLSIMLLLISCNDTNSKPSIKDNSVRKVESEKVDYSDMDSKKLYKHIIAHYDLEQYQVGKEKLNALMSNRPDMIDSLELNQLKSKFDKKLAQMLEKEQAIAEAERKSRMPNATKNMRFYKKGNLAYFVDKTSPEFDTKECFYAYITKNKAGIVSLNFKIRYIDTQWLNIENFMITIDQLDYSLSGEIIKSETKGKKKYKHELLDMPIASSDNFNLLNAIASGQNVTAVYIGKSTYKKREISKEQQIAVRNVLDAYLFMGGRDIAKAKPEYTSNNK